MTMTMTATDSSGRTISSTRSSSDRRVSYILKAFLLLGIALCIPAILFSFVVFSFVGESRMLSTTIEIIAQPTQQQQQQQHNKVDVTRTTSTTRTMTTPSSLEQNYDDHEVVATVAVANLLRSSSSSSSSSNSGGGVEEIVIMPELQNSSCPYSDIIQTKIGLFDFEKSNSTQRHDFNTTVLVVAANYAYYNMLQNWEYLAKEQGLKWIVLALDQKLYELLGPERAIPPSSLYAVDGAHGWGHGNFTKISCNKIRMTLDLATCGGDDSQLVDGIVFTDADNIFLKNPFEHDFGALIKSQKYDYVYQSNHEPTHGQPRTDECLLGKPRKEANTGFYYFKSQSDVYKTIAQATLDRCDLKNNKLDDQSLFWQEFWKYQKEKKQQNQNTNTNTTIIGDGSNIDFHHCGLEYDNNNNDPTASTSNTNVFNYCCLDPYYYPIGKHGHRQGPPNKDPITYHANYAQQYGRKVEKLMYSRKDHYGWDQSRFNDGIGGILF
jgi:hypothetical protein